MEKFKLQHWFLLWVISMLVLVILTLPEERPDRLDVIDFNTTESAELYFRNVRAYHYEFASEGGDMFDVYRLKSLFDADEEPALPLVIYHNWRSNEAFVRLDTNYINVHGAGLLRDSVRTLFRLSLPEMYNEAQYAFAVRLYRSLRDEERLAILGAAMDTTWLEGDRRKHTMRVLTDYFKLVGRL